MTTTNDTKDDDDEEDNEEAEAEEDADAPPTHPARAGPLNFYYSGGEIPKNVSWTGQ